MSDACTLERNDFRLTYLARALGNDNFCNKGNPLLIFSSIPTIKYIHEITAFFVYIFVIISGYATKNMDVS